MTGAPALRVPIHLISNNGNRSIVRPGVQPYPGAASRLTRLATLRRSDIRRKLFGLCVKAAAMYHAWDVRISSAMISDPNLCVSGV